MVFGRDAKCEVPLQIDGVSRKHCTLVLEFERFWLRDLGSTHGTWLHGARVLEEELQHGDVFQVMEGQCYRLLLREPSAPPREPTMEAALRANPDDEQAWSVYADWLLEHGEPVASGDGPLSTFGALASEVVNGNLTATWRHGLVRELSFRVLEGLHAWPAEARLSLVERTPGLRFVTRVEVDVESFFRRAVHNAEPFMRALTALNSPLLRTVVLGPTEFSGPLERAGVDVQLRRPGPATLTLMSEHPGTPVMGPNGELELARPEVLSRPARFELRGISHFTVTPTDGPWLVEFGGRGRLNGRVAQSATLRGGDVLELAPGVTLRFER